VQNAIAFLQQVNVSTATLTEIEDNLRDVLTLLTAAYKALVREDREPDYAAYCVGLLNAVNVLLEDVYEAHPVDAEELADVEELIEKLRDYHQVTHPHEGL
jgi:hypothetical protein